MSTERGGDGASSPATGHTALLRLELPCRVIASELGVSLSLACMWRARHRLPTPLRRAQLELAFRIPASSWDGVRRR